ncbi:hypothetical protein ABZ926_14975 [Streptomyces litmocidini]|uniref:hypothetical protein n=1 Tax=Streptomyces litmocidini TaxID=67318 RepID=UPI0034041471
MSAVQQSAPQSAEEPAGTHPQVVHRPAEDGPVLLTARAAIVMTVGGLIGVAVAVLTYLGDHGLAAAALAGLTAGGTSILGLNKVIGS